MQAAPCPRGWESCPIRSCWRRRATDADRVFGAAVGQDLPAYDDALAAIAAHLVTSNEVAGDTTTVTPRMRAMLFQRLQGSGLHVSGALFTAASAAVDRDLGSAMMRAAYGSKAALRRRLVADDQVEAARALLVAHPTPRAVLMLGRGPRTSWSRGGAVGRRPAPAATPPGRNSCVVYVL